MHKEMARKRGLGAQSFIDKTETQNLDGEGNFDYSEDTDLKKEKANTG